MNKKYLFLFLTFLTGTVCDSPAQRIVPAPPQSGPVVIRGGTIHTGNGSVIENGVVRFENGRITYAGSSSSYTQDNTGVTIVEAAGKHVYPGLIAPNTQLGLNEIEAARATNDFQEVGSYNPGLRSLTAYNTDSRVIPTVRSNGILIAQSVPMGAVISGTSSVMQLDAWNWEDARYKADDGIHLNWPGYFSYRFSDGMGSVSMNTDYEKQVFEIRQYFDEAKAYNAQERHQERNINFEAMSGIFNQSKILYIHCQYVREIMNAIQFAKDIGARMVIVGGRDAYLCTSALKENNVAVVLGNVHDLPAGDDTELEIPYRTAAMLQQAGVNYCLSVTGYWSVRNLPFMAGTAVAYGLSREDALKSITSSAARILGIDDRTGTIEAGKDANILVSDGDLLDMKTSNVTVAFIQGRQIDLDDAQKQLYRIYSEKYGIR